MQFSGMVVLVLLLVGFAAGYGVRELISRRRIRKYYERKEILKQASLEAEKNRAPSLSDRNHNK
jgi:hypothetical protein